MNVAAKILDINIASIGGSLGVHADVHGIVWVKILVPVGNVVRRVRWLVEDGVDMFK
jgi:hypothetical protein